mmetsp:Transcript_16237/g.26603  ORF Transcript_16237/g.26603 Transcript_16237/m.26603 type:complete len:296 (+) Transcript_16237:42-929(+)|eukprot:CAMPEP_0184338966 /NCGR_PEP_ID=MMETSP1089-20130417/7612_1 /TAXON_ID=38269 ORGANISM="Gloeochaete wittrockiana, Strain SAG46.84" /NCGR_SAMPLE_ID=MMETSP1089 /ASSEMBLY_ACC=CAM_ASM_000445 /LENGTH=295 /DNA_ID=CAMNT_0026665909 /DNA_START=14 /DNA_END=904 /DNA_ORIENTATION=-
MALEKVFDLHGINSTVVYWTFIGLSCVFMLAFVVISWVMRKKNSAALSFQGMLLAYTVVEFALCLTVSDLWPSTGQRVLLDLHSLFEMLAAFRMMFPLEYVSHKLFAPLLTYWSVVTVLTMAPPFPISYYILGVGNVTGDVILLIACVVVFKRSADARAKTAAVVWSLHSIAAMAFVAQYILMLRIVAFIWFAICVYNLIYTIFVTPYIFVSDDLLFQYGFLPEAPADALNKTLVDGKKQGGGGLTFSWLFKWLNIILVPYGIALLIISFATGRIVISDFYTNPTELLPANILNA